MAKSLNVAVSGGGVLKRHEKMLDTIRGGTENEAIALFSEEKYDVNTVVDYTFDDRKKYKVTPLAWAVRCRRPLLCRYLIQNGAEPFTHLVFDYYPLHEACNRGFDEIVKNFVELKCDIDHVTADKLSPLHVACMRGNVECARLLLEAGASQDLRDSKGLTPLELGLYHGQMGLDQIFSCYESKRKITRRHSLHSPTGDVRPMLRLLPSTHSKSLTRPTSMQLDLEDPVVLLEPGRTASNANDQYSATLLVPTSDSITANSCQVKGGRSRSKSNQNVAHGPSMSPSFLSTAPQGGSCTAPQALSSSPLHPAPSTLNSALSTPSSFCSSRPTLMAQISCASSSVADSPSPVERDGLVSSGSMASSESGPSISNFAHIKSVEHKSLDIPNRTSLETRRNDQYSLNDCLGAMQSSKLVRIASKTKPHCGSTTQQHLVLRKQPHHSHSNPEFPLTRTHVSVSQPDRMHSYDDLYAPRRKPPFHRPTSNEVSPSREKINNLSSHICSSLDQNWPASLSYETGSYQHLLDTSSSSPVCEVMQKVIKVTTPLLNFNQAHIQTLMSSCSTAHLSEQDFFMSSSSSSLTSSGDSNLTNGEQVHECLTSHLNKLGYKVIEKPVKAEVGVPQSGFVTLCYNVIGQDVQTGDALLKVILKVCDSKFKEERSSYHYSLDDQPLSLFNSSPTPLPEVYLLTQLSKSPHPNITSLIASFRAHTTKQHELFAQQLSPETPQTIFAATHVADCIVVEQPKVQLCDFFESQRRSRKCFRSHDVIPESTVLSILSQLLLAISHLVKNQIAHCAVKSGNVHVDQDNNNSIHLCNFSQAEQLDTKKLSLERIRHTQGRLKAEVSFDMSRRHCVLAPEVVEAVENSELEIAFIKGTYKNIFAKNDAYGVALLVYNCFLNKSHSFLNRDRRKPYEYREIPDLTEFSPQCNHLLKKLVAYDHKERLAPMDGAMACFVLLFGPVVSEMKSEDQCYKWLLAETVEFYMRPVLVDSKMRDYADSFSKLLCMYLAVASSNPRKVWEACRFFSSCAV